MSQHGESGNEENPESACTSLKIWMPAGDEVQWWGTCLAYKRPLVLPLVFQRKQTKPTKTREHFANVAIPTLKRSWNYLESYGNVMTSLNLNWYTQAPHIYSERATGSTMESN